MITISTTYFIYLSLRIDSRSMLFTYREEVKRSMYWLIKHLI